MKMEKRGVQNGKLQALDWKNADPKMEICRTWKDPGKDAGGLLPTQQLDAVVTFFEIPNFL